MLGDLLSHPPDEWQSQVSIQVDPDASYKNITAYREIFNSSNIIARGNP